MFVQLDLVYEEIQLMAKMNTTPVFQVKSMALLHVDPGSILLAVSYLISHVHDHSNSYTVQYEYTVL